MFRFSLTLPKFVTFKVHSLPLSSDPSEALLTAAVDSPSFTSLVSEAHALSVTQETSCSYDSLYHSHVKLTHFLSLFSCLTHTHMLQK